MISGGPGYAEGATGVWLPTKYEGGWCLSNPSKHWSQGRVKPAAAKALTAALIRNGVNNSADLPVTVVTAVCYIMVTEEK
jgi:hypothetical protein